MVVAGLVLIFTLKPQFGIDFTGGTLVEIKLNQDSNITEVRDKVKSLTSEEILVQESGKNQYIIRTKNLTGEDYNKFAANITSSFPDVNILRHDNIGASVGQNLTNKAITAIVIAALLIIIYLAYTFRTVPKSISSWAFGTIAVFALVHDLIFSFAMYAIAGKVAGFEIEAMIVVAALTILGFSVHDTIVVFDRIRENITKSPGKSLAENAEASVNQTFARSLNTSMTVVLVLVSMFLLGGATIQPFVLMLIIGITVGTYSSIFVASPMLVWYYEYKDKQRFKEQEAQKQGTQN